MRDIFKKATTFTKIEFWAITTIFVFVLFFFIIDSFNNDQVPYASASYYPFFEKSNIPFDFYRNYFLPQIIRHTGLYLALIPLNFIVIPALLNRVSLLRNIIRFIVIFFALVLLYSVTATWLQGYRYAGASRDNVNQDFFENGLDQAWAITWVFVIYTAIKYAGMRLLDVSEKIEARYRFIRKEAIVAAGIWLAGLLFLRFGRAESEFLVGWLIVIPTAIVLYLYSYYRLIPGSLANKKYPFLLYVVKCAGLLFLAFIVIYLVSIFFIYEDDAGAGYGAFNSFFQLFITVPVTWFLYKRRQKGNEEINVLQKELTRSSASFDFLRSQINPHFLFNALNTLYGTALQENADRTGEGIQKLGDMMRFMLQENMQENISLTREIEYLDNYISLQKLRTDSNPNIRIETHIEKQNQYVQIAPMLLIPFVENAFKHGISFREASEIKITLEIKNDSLYFDVYNNKHIRPSNDPEKDKSGIGLTNVKQRLQLLYNGRHELMIRETAKDFFVHLTLQLA